MDRESGLSSAVTGCNSRQLIPIPNRVPPVPTPTHRRKCRRVISDSILCSSWLIAVVSLAGPSGPVSATLFGSAASLPSPRNHQFLPNRDRFFAVPVGGAAVPHGESHRMFASGLQRNIARYAHIQRPPKDHAIGTSLINAGGRHLLVAFQGMGLQGAEPSGAQVFRGTLPSRVRDNVRSEERR